MTQLPSIQRTLLESMASSDPDGRFIEVDGIQTYYKIATPQRYQQQLHKPVILLLHHIFGNLYTWRHHMQPLADATGCHVIAYDRPTFGFTERPTQWEEGKNPYTQLASVDFAIQLILNLGYNGRKIVFVGVSTGAAISCAVAIKYPKLVHSLCLMGPSITSEDQGPPPITRHVLSSVPGRLYIKATLYRNLPHAMLYHDVNSIPDWETTIKPNARVPLTLPNFYESCSLLMKHFIPLEILPYKNLLSQIPILYIVGDDDRYTHIDRHKEIYNDIALNAPQNAKMEFKIINNAGHLPQEERPQEILYCIVDFLSRVGI